MESPEIDPHKYSQLIFDKGTKAIQWSKDSLFKQMVLEQMDICMQKKKKMNLDTDLTPFIEIN